LGLALFGQQRAQMKAAGQRDTGAAEVFIEFKGKRFGP
jgi:hypothetical protein